MSQEDPKLPGKERNLLAGFLKFLFFIFALFAVMVTILFNMGGSSETLHASLEKLISDSLGGRPTRVMKLNRVSFFPTVGADFEQLEIKETMASQELTVSAEKVRLFVSFWGFITRRMGIRSVYFENIKIRKGLLGRNAFTIEKLFIDHDKGTQNAMMRASGMLEQEPWALAMNLDVGGSVGGYTYHVGKNRDVTLEIGDLRLKARLSEQISDYLKVENVSIGMPDEILKGELSVSLLEGQMVKLGGRLTAGKTASILSPDLMVEYGKSPVRIVGKIDSLQIDPEYMESPEGPIALLNGLHEMLAYDLAVPQDQPDEEQKAGKGKDKGGDEKPEKPGKDSKPAEMEKAFACRYDFDLNFAINKEIDKNGKEAEGFAFNVVNKSGELTVTPVKGAVKPYRGPCRDLPMLKVERKAE